MNPLSLLLDAAHAEPSTVEHIRQVLGRHPGNAGVELRIMFGDGVEPVLLHLAEPADPFDRGLLRKLAQLQGVEIDDDG